MADLSCCRIHVYGRVQGVWYRDATRQQAEALGVTGWVRNLADGSVEAELHGSTSRVAALVAWCHQGPPLAEVTRVTSSPCAPHGTCPPRFVIRRD